MVGFGIRRRPKIVGEFGVELGVSSESVRILFEKSKTCGWFGLEL